MTGTTFSQVFNLKWISEEGRQTAIKRYKIVGLLMGLAAAVLLIIGIVAVTKYPDAGFGPPYYIGGFTGGIVVSF